MRFLWTARRAPGRVAGRSSVEKRGAPVELSGSRGNMNSSESTSDGEVAFAGLVLDRSAVEAGAAEFVLGFIDDYGLNPLLVRVLTTAESRALLPALGHGNPREPMDPGLFIPAVDLCPVVPGRSHLREAPGLDNARLFRLTRSCQKKLRSRYPELGSRSLLHRSKNAEQAWQFVRAVMPEEEASLRELIELRQQAFVTPFPVLRRLSGGYEERAKVEVVDFHGLPAVCKTFRPGQEDFLRRELAALTELRGRMQEVPEVLAHGDNWLVMPLYQDSGRFRRRNRFGLLPLAVSRELIQVLERLYEAGYAHLDMQAKNVIFDERQGVKILDFEFVYRYSSPPGSFAESYDIVGWPPAAARELVAHGIVPQASYATRLQPLTGLDFRSLRHDPEWKQHLKRALYVPTGMVPRLARGWLIGTLKPALRQLRRESTRLGSRMRGGVAPG
ncbi:MAG: hypothetical protein M3418_10905 [Gemmatimonadota bacterium]|nr:hypothetical protein [Gemmatimonadota bacterium]